MRKDRPRSTQPDKQRKEDDPVHTRSVDRGADRDTDEATGGEGIDDPAPHADQEPPQVHDPGALVRGGR